jgi:hypothetical protein
MKSKGTVANNLVKQPYSTENYTPEQFAEFMACCDPITGPEYFLRNFFYIQSEKTGRQLFSLFDYQLELLQNYQDHKYSVNMLSRQLGKCLEKKVNITIRNKTTGFVYDIPIGIFHEYQAAKQAGTDTPDIEPYRRKDVSQ